MNEEIRFLQWIGYGSAQEQPLNVLKLHHKMLHAYGLNNQPFSGIEEALDALTPQAEDYSCFY